MEQEQTEKQERVFEIVRFTREAAKEGVLALGRRAQEEGPIDHVFYLVTLRASYPWRDTVPGWYTFRDRLFRDWPDEATKKRELHGLDAEPETTPVMDDYLASNIMWEALDLLEEYPEFDDDEDGNKHVMREVIRQAKECKIHPLLAFVAEFPLYTE